MIDQGRLLFRNTDQDKYGLHNFPARRGYRPEILDPLVAAHRTVRNLGGSANPDGSKRLYEWRGRFISLLQYEIDPTWLQNARYYTDGPGSETGISVRVDSEPPKWPEDRLPV